MEECKVIITGASRGIGLSTAEVLISKGYKVYSISRSKPDNTMIGHIKCDLSCTSSVTELYHIIKDINPTSLVNNVGIDNNGPFLDQTVSDIINVINTNFTSHYILTQHFVTNLLAQQSPGKVVFVTSIWGNRSTKYRSLYSASKFALEGLSRSLASEFVDNDIMVNCVAPSFTNINSTTSIESKYFRDEQHMSSLCKLINGGRLAEPVEVANSISWLLSDECTYMTGQTINIDRGDMLC